MRKKIRLFTISVVTLLVIITISSIAVFYTKLLPKEKVISPVPTPPVVLELLATLENRGFEVEALPFEEESSVIASVSGTKIIFSKSKSPQSQVKALQLVIESLKMEAVKPKEIDLRFDKVILRY